MLEPDFIIPENSYAMVVSLVCDALPGHTDLRSTLASLKELKELLRTLGVQCNSEHIQNRKKIEAATVMGKGKLEELAIIIQQAKIQFLVFDIELSASQVRNIKKIVKVEVIDRCSVILEIFARHAKTKEASIQIEVSRLEYLLPRLTSFWTHFTKTKGGIGHRGGEGEQQLELDRRLIRDRILIYKKQLAQIACSKEQQAKKRRKNVIMAALVGYTNAGKSSLLNRLCKETKLEEDKLFATLDTTVRLLNPNSKPPMLLIDTVGLISNLPTFLINGFKSTLSSALEADLLLIVCDISDEEYEKHLEVTFEFLKELEMDGKEYFIVFNKKDLLTDPLQAKIALNKYPNSFMVSSFDKEEMVNLRHAIINYFLEKQDHYDLFIPYDQGQFHSVVLSQTNVLNQENHQDGIFYRVRIPQFIFDKLGLSQFITAPKGGPASEAALLKSTASKINNDSKIDDGD